MAEVYALERRYWRELERLSLEGDLETQAALDRFLLTCGRPVARVRSQEPDHHRRQELHPLDYLAQWLLVCWPKGGWARRGR